jgi:hypothetical protein
MQIEDRSWMYESDDVLALFKGVSIFLKRQYIVLVKYATTT